MSRNDAELGLGMGSHSPNLQSSAYVNMDEAQPSKKKKWLSLLGALLLGAGIATAILLIARHAHSDSSDPDAAPWSPASFVEGWEFYKNIEPHPITVHDNQRLTRLGAPVLSPDGKIAVFTRTQIDQVNINRSATTLWYYVLPYTNGYAAKPLTRPIWGVHDSQPNFDASSRTVFFVSNRQPSDSGVYAPASTSQIFHVKLPSLKARSGSDSAPVTMPVSWLSGLASNAVQSSKEAFESRLADDVPSELPTPAQAKYVEPQQLTSFPISVDNLLVGAVKDTDRSHVAFSVRVFPGLTMAQTVERQQQARTRGGEWSHHTSLFVRQWDEFETGERNHVFLMSVTHSAKDGSVTEVSEAIDLIKDLNSDVPTKPDGDARSEWSFSCTGGSFAFTRKTFDGTTQVAISTNTDIYTVTIPTDAPFRVSAPECITCDNIALDFAPAYSPVNPNQLIYLSTITPGYESDRFGIKLYDAAAETKIQDLTATWSDTVGSARWNAAGTALYVEMPIDGSDVLRLWNFREEAAPQPLIESGSNSGAQVAPDDSFVVYSSSSYSSPASIQVKYFMEQQGVTQGDLTVGFNEAALSKLQMSNAISITFPGGKDQQVQAWFFLPVGFDATKKYPLAMLCHGGPQNPWSDGWSYRWHPQIYAAAGYAVVMVNFHGSMGWGQEFVDSIRGNYGSLPYEDHVKAINYLLDESQWATNLDSERLVALGASYGGYMVNWIAGNQWQQKYKFKALVCHDGLFDMNSFYHSTEQLYFPEHDIPGIPWEHPENYARWNPASPERLSRWDTPQLIIHGGLDYRVDPGQGLGAFTVLQRKGVPSELLYFPNEAHQVFNYQNQIQWHTTVLNWINKWTAVTEEQRSEL